MEECSEIKIWKYMDLAKFIYMLITESLYFACPLKFNDPCEGLLPRSHIEANLKMMAPIVQDIISIRNKLADKYSDSIDLQQSDAKIDGLKNMLETLGIYKKVIKKFGVSCWHKSEYESEAMWRLYSASGQGIAIESTIEQLKLSLGKVERLIINCVRYRDFDNASIEKGHEHNILFMKRESFEYEKESRATVCLPKEKEGEGDNILCNLNTLITHIHVSPYASNYFNDVVNALCHSKIGNFEKPVIRSKLFSEPNYGIKIQDLIK